MSVPLVVVRFSSSKDKDGTKTRIEIDKNATLKALRSLLDMDSLIKPKDIFEDLEGIGIAKGSEENTKWSTIATKDKQSPRLFIRAADSTSPPPKNVPLPKLPEAPKDHKDAQTSVESGIVGHEELDKLKHTHFGSGASTTEPGDNVNELDANDLKNLIENASLGWGIDATKVAAHCFVALVVKPVAPHDIHCLPIRCSDQYTTISASSHDASYASAGWTEAGISAETPWISGSIGGGGEKSKSSSTSNSSVYVTGRWAYTQCLISLPVDGLEPEKALKTAVDEALGKKTTEEQKKDLEAVFKKYGYYFISAVEMGGVKILKAETLADKASTEQEMKWHMGIALSKRFGPAKVSANVEGGNSSSSADIKANMWDGAHVYTHGGNTATDDISEWKLSLLDYHTWMPVRPVKVREVVELFDKDVRDKITALVPKPPPPPPDTPTPPQPNPTPPAPPAA